MARSSKGGIDPDAPRCGGKLKYGKDKRCTQVAGWGTPHNGEGLCKLHDPEFIAAQKRADEKPDVGPVYGERSEMDAYDALLDLIQHSVGHVAWLRAQVRDIESSKKAFSNSERQKLALYREERKQLAVLCQTAITARLPERQARITARQGQLIVQATVRALNTVGINGDLRQSFIRALANELRLAIAGRQPIEALAIEAPPVTTATLSRWSVEDEPDDDEGDERFAAWYEANRQVPTNVTVVVP